MTAGPVFTMERSAETPTVPVLENESLLLFESDVVVLIEAVFEIVVPFATPAPTV
jgi:hypothetical protein